MKYLAIIFFSLLAILWFYISWFILKDFNTEIYQQSTNIITAILLAGVFTFGFLLSKLIYKNNCEDFIENNILDEEKFEKKLEEDFFIPEIEEVKEKKYNDYEKDSEITKESIDIILDEKEENFKHNVNLKEELFKKDFEEIIEIKEKKEENIIDKTLLNVANNLKKQKKQDLKMIEGIGPKIEILLNNNGIYSYKDLANTTIEKLKEILYNTNKRYIILHNPTTWPKQATMADKGDFEKLTKYQDKLIKGIEK